ncbi:MAG TPA: 2-oxo-4-hydroxy-4-carboxy-5-ureidoimidazoline decarboxylase [Pseudolabrys sp.]|nr:2-oxo-4-hydroxy-4-carboxy-5-ureidoimidazoline decarboxylase [Pseudolabrys sp.]
MSAISLERLNAATPEDFVAALGAIYEHSPWVAEAAAARRPFATLQELHDAMSGAARGSDDTRKRALLKAHPDLAGKAARAGELTDDSKREQNSAGLDRLSADEYEEFHRLNKAYHDKFGFPFIVCVRRHGKESIFRQFEARLRNDLATEYDAALAEVIRIAALRLDQHVDAPDKLPVHGRLSTHVLDTHLGKPAQGVAFALDALDGAGPIARGVTNADGRTDAPLIAGRPVPIGRYELRFAVGDYFKRRGVPLADPPFLDVVPLRFSIAEPEGHYHVPLLVTPWSYSTYRGS